MRSGVASRVWGSCSRARARNTSNNACVSGERPASSGDFVSMRIESSATTRRSSSTKTAGSAPGSNRTSSCAEAWLGMTFTLLEPSSTVTAMVLRKRALPAGSRTANSAPLVEHHAGILHEVPVLVDDEPRPHGAARLLVRGAEEDDVGTQRHGMTLEHEHGHELEHARALHVERAPAPDVTVLHLATE